MNNKPEQLEPTSTESLANLWRGQADSIMRQLDYVNAYPDAPMREVKALRQCAEQLETWGTDSTLKGIIRKYIDDSTQKDRVDKIDDLIHLLNYERRLATLTPNQREHMNNRELSPAARAKLDEAIGKLVFSAANEGGVKSSNAKITVPEVVFEPVLALHQSMIL
jgi:hypothetical protein